MNKEFKFDPVKHVYTLNGKRMYGITTVLGVIGGSKTGALMQWAVNEGIKSTENWIKKNQRDLRDSAGINGVVVFADELQEALKEAKYAHRKKKEKAGEMGTDVHAEIEKTIKIWIEEGTGYSGELAVYEGIWTRKDVPEQLKHFVRWACNNKVKFLESEKQMYHENLFIAGTVDFIFEKEGKTYIGDVKTFAKMWDRTAMLQCAGYGLMYEHMYGKKIDGYCIVRLGKDGTFSEHWSKDVEGDTKGFLSAVQLFKTLENW